MDQMGCLLAPHLPQGTTKKICVKKKITARKSHGLMVKLKIDNIDLRENPLKKPLIGRKLREIQVH